MRLKQITTMALMILCLTGMGCIDRILPAKETSAGQEQASEAHAGFPPPAVDIVTVETRPYTRTADLPGRISAVRSAEVCARVAGIVLSREFEEGSDVKKGDILFRIDPAPFQAALAGAEAEMARARADLYDVQTIFRRYKKLVKSEAVSQQVYDSAAAKVKMGEAAVALAQANIRTARLNLNYATVRAPISGRIGRARVTEGALVGQGTATVMAQIRQLDPIYADFNQPVSEYLRLKTRLTKTDGSQNTDARVILTLEEIKNTRTGRLLFTDARVDETTGQVSLRSEFPNEDGLLLPGMFVRIKTPLSTNPEAVFIPQRAVLRDADGKARVMVVGDNGVANPRDVITGTMVDGSWEILRGLSAGEKVVSTGADKVRPGMALAMADTDVPVAETAVN
ncbi:MAG: efflux RND transporter periplasmic adaptor subunit [Desulfobacterales bacterium]|nr:efflux RND transporter periplasmic adaptor subunit [Desulfobacterales bacterium]